MTDRKIEILAPAGSYASFKAALCAGADAVYAGGSQFGARAYADNFTKEELIAAIREAHLHGRRLYLTVNTLLKDSEISGLYEWLLPFYECGLDAVIVQDTGVFELVRTCFPGLDIHVSTQMSIAGAYGAKFMESQGATRVVPARELSLGEIRQIRRETDLEIECFVHGALCYCYSGQCLLSSMIGGRSGNRGQCAQPCRLPYTVDGRKRHFLSPKDICTLEIIPDLIEAGVDSFKIEGRMKKPEYVAAVTAMYRKYTDLFLKSGREGYHVLPGDRDMLMDLYNRGGSSTGYYKTHNGPDMMAFDRPNHAGVPALSVQSQKGRRVCAKALRELSPGDVIEITGGKDNYTTGSRVGAGDEISFLVQRETRLKPGTILPRIRSASLIDRIQKTYTDAGLRRGITGMFTAEKGSPAVLSVSCDGVTCNTFTEEPVQQAQSRPADEASVQNRLEKTGGTAFFFRKLEINMESDLFLPVGQLNLLRRDALEKLKRSIAAKYERPRPEGYPEETERQTGCGSKYGTGCGIECGAEPSDDRTESSACDAMPLSVSVQTEEQLSAVLSFAEENRGAVGRVHADLSIFSGSAAERESKAVSAADCVSAFHRAGVRLGLSLPHIFRQGALRGSSDVRRTIEELLKSGNFDHVLIRNYEEFQLLLELKFDKTVILDHNLYVFNRYAKVFWNRLGVTEFTAPLELNARELESLGLSDCELAVSGPVPVMLSSQCLLRSTGRCTSGKKGHTAVLTDRFGNRYPSVSRCDSCYSILYNYEPLYLGEEAERIRMLFPAALRAEFVSEDRSQVFSMLNRIKKAFRGEDPGDVPFPYTEGHFNRGVR